MVELETSRVGGRAGSEGSKAQTEQLGLFALGGYRDIPRGFQVSVAGNLEPLFVFSIPLSGFLILISQLF